MNEQPDHSDSYNPDCPACIGFRLHTENEWEQFHPLHGHGFTRETGWTHPELEKRTAKREGKGKQ